MNGPKSSFVVDFIVMQTVVDECGGMWLSHILSFLVFIFFSISLSPFEFHDIASQELEWEFWGGIILNHQPNQQIYAGQIHQSFCNL